MDSIFKLQNQKFDIQFGLETETNFFFKELVLGVCDRDTDRSDWQEILATGKIREIKKKTRIESGNFKVHYLITIKNPLKILKI